MAIGFTNSFTSGEIYSDFDDRIEIQPVDKGCRSGSNLIVQIAGPLKKRRGFWFNMPSIMQGQPGRLIPFKRSVDDAAMLELGDLTARVYQANGSPMLDGTGQMVNFATPYHAGDLAGLRYCQVGNVIYFRHSGGVIPPYTLTRVTNQNWTWTLESFPNGPWLTENTDPTTTLTVSGSTTITDATGGIEPPAQAVQSGSVTLTANKPIFNAAMVGDSFRIRAGTGSASCRGWTPGDNTPVGCFVVSVGNIYVSTNDAGQNSKLNASNPPVQTQGLQSDGCSTFRYLHDGAGIITITSVTSPTVIVGNVTACLPIGNGDVTSYFSFAAYGSDVGWPRAWPTVTEERLVSGATATNLDMLDLTRVAGFTPTKEDYHPSQGTGGVVDTDALRRRLGNGTGEILWTLPDSFLVAGSVSQEFVVGPGLFGEALTPSSVVCRKVSGWGSADVGPVQVHQGLCWVTRGGWSVRKMSVDLQQNAASVDLSYLARHIALRGYAQLAWTGFPDECLWVRLSDGGLACLTMHDEQQVRGWTTQNLAGGMVVEDLVSLPGPGGFDALWIQVALPGGPGTQRWVMMQSQASDGLFMDAASAYAGPPVTEIGNLQYLAEQTVRVLADGVMQTDRQVSSAGVLTLDVAASNVLVGLPYQIGFASLKLDKGALGGALLARQRVAEALVDLECVKAYVGIEGAAAMQAVSGRLRGDVQTVIPRRTTAHVGMGGDTSRDPRIIITEDSAYDFGIFAIRPEVVAGGGT